MLRPLKEVKKLTGAPIAVVNSVRNGASTYYKELVPYATDNADVFRSIGDVITGDPNLMNEFAQGLFNRAYFAIFANHLYYKNPWGWVTKGKLELGDTIQEIYQHLADPYDYNVEIAAKEWMDIVPNESTAVFHTLNYTKFYKKSLSVVEMRKAFVSFSAFEQFYDSIIQIMYDSAENDLYLAARYMLGIKALRGEITGVSIPGGDTVQNIKDTVKVARAIAATADYFTDRYNTMHVDQRTNIDKLRFIVTADYEAEMDVEVLASTFHMEKSEFIGKRVVMPSWKDLNVARLDKLLGQNPGYHSFTKSELEALDNVHAFIIDEDWFQFYDYVLESRTSIENPQGLYYNVFYHVQKIMSASPFQTAVMLTGGEQKVDSVTLNISNVTLPVGGTISASATVVTENFAPKTLIWTSSDNTIATVDASGNITAIKEGAAVITATSQFDNTKTATVDVTVTNAN